MYATGLRGVRLADPEPDEAFLREVPVVCENVLNLLLPHDVHGKCSRRS
jgi:hypothetical protein